MPGSFRGFPHPSKGKTAYIIAISTVHCKRKPANSASRHTPIRMADEKCDSGTAESRKIRDKLSQIFTMANKIMGK